MPNPELIDFPVTVFSTPSSSNIFNTSALTLTGDILCLVWRSDAASNAQFLPSGWTNVLDIGSLDGISGSFKAAFKISAADGSEAVTLATNDPGVAIAGVATLRGASASPLDAYYFIVSNSDTYSLVTQSITPYSGGVIVGFSQDPASQTWSTSPSIPQQGFGFDAAAGQMAVYYSNETTSPAIVYDLTKTGSPDIGFAAVVYFKVQPIVVSGPTSSGANGTPYSSSTSATGGTGPYTYTVSGTLPLGVTLDGATGVISGTPTGGAVSTFIITATDTEGNTGTGLFSIGVSGGPTPPVGSPVAAHTFDFTFTYASTYAGGGAWTDPIKITEDQSTFSAGALAKNPSGPLGIIGSQAGTGDLYFFGNGLPDVPRKVVASTMPGGTAALDYWDLSEGAWFFDNTYFLITFNRDDQTWSMLSCADPGSGDPWIVEDLAHTPTFFDEGQLRYSTWNDKFYLFTDINDSPYEYAFWIFDFATRLWSLPFGNIDFGGYVETGSPQNALGGIVPFPNGDIGIFYNTDGGEEVYYKRWSPVTGWDASVLLYTSPNPGTVICRFGNLLIDTLDQNLIHVFIFISPGGPSISGVYSTVTKDGTFYGDLFTWPNQPEGGDGFGHGQIRDGLLFVPFDDFADNTNAVWIATQGSADFIKTLLPIPPGEEDKDPSCVYMIYDSDFCYLSGTTCTIVIGGARRAFSQYIHRSNAPGVA